MNLHATPFPDVNEILSLLFTNVKEILDDQLVGMYLHGSLANGGFDANSDIDIIFTTKDGISDETVSVLQAMHTEISKMESSWATQLEVAYIPQSALSGVGHSPILYPHLDRGKGEVLHKIAPESDWAILRHILRERGITIMGPEPKALIESVSPNELRRGVVEGMPIWFAPIIANPAEMEKRGYQSFFVLSICRMLYTLKHGEILSKPSAAEWGKENLDPQWGSLIERALIGRQNSDLAADKDDVRRTVEMMQYALQQIKPTMYPEVNEVLNLLLKKVKEILQDQFVSMYLYGSLSSGDFNTETSDIDFLCVTNEALSDETISGLETMHKQIWATRLKYAGQLEGAYVSKELIRKHDPKGKACPTVNEGKFYVAELGSDWIIQRHVVREYGIVVEGPDPKTLIDFVTPDDIRTAVMGILREWWFPMLEDPTWLQNHESNYHGYTVITMCRAVHALKHGAIVSKPIAIQWANSELGAPWQPLIEQAVASQYGIHSDFLNETLEFMRFIKETIEKGNYAESSS